jgi:NADH-quinone oxidoreductase subunit L
LGALLTAFYMTRQVYYVFAGSNRLTSASHRAGLAAEFEDPAHRPTHLPHESPAIMTIPLVILAAFAVLLGFIGTPAWPWFQSFLENKSTTLSFVALSEPGIVQVMLVSSLLVLLGLGLGWYFYGRKPIENDEVPDALGTLQPSVFTVLGNAYFIDALYAATILRLNSWSAKASAWLDQRVWNGAVQTVSYFFVGVAWLDNFIDTGVINSAFDSGCGSASRGGQLLALVQGGRIQTYLRIIGCALVALVIFLLWGAKA